MSNNKFGRWIERELARQSGLYLRKIPGFTRGTSPNAKQIQAMAGPIGIKASHLAEIAGLELMDPQFQL